MRKRLFVSVITATAAIMGVFILLGAIKSLDKTNSTSITSADTEADSGNVSTTEAQNEDTTQNTRYIEKDISDFINESGDTIATRINTPSGYYRLEVDADSFSYYVRNLPVKEDGSDLYLYNGELASNQTWHVAIIDLNETVSALNGTPYVTYVHEYQQCADTVIRVISDYLYLNKRYEQVSFDFMDGFNCNLGKWVLGYRAIIDYTGAVKTYWEQTASEDYSYETYWNYLTTVYAYAGTNSLELQTNVKNIDINDIYPGCFFVKGSDYVSTSGHAVMVVDVCKNVSTGDVAFLLAEGNTPADEFHIFTNPLHYNDPWFYLSELSDDTIKTPFYEFSLSNCLKYYVMN